MTGPRPPLLGRILLGLLPRRRMRDLVRGDLDEAFSGWVSDRLEPRAARRWYVRQVTASVLSVWWDGLKRTATAMGRDGMGGWGRTMMQSARALRRRPGFALSVVLTLGIGMGATTAVYSVVDGILLTPVNLPQAEELVVVWTEQNGELYNNSTPNLADLRAGVTGLEELYVFTSDVSLVRGEDGTERSVPSVFVTWPLLSVLDTAPALGRDLRESDQGGGVRPVALISHGYWADVHGSDPGVIGTTIVVDGEGTEIVGVLPEGVHVPLVEDARLILPFDESLTQRGRDLIWVGGMGRLHDGVAQEQAVAQTEAVWEGLRAEYPDAILDRGIALVPLQSYMVADVRRALLVLLGATGFLLLIGCLNAGGLMAVRANSRQGELAVRASLGAGPVRLVRELVVEGVWLVTSAALLGVGGAYLGLKALRGMAPADLPRAELVAIDARVLVVAIGAGVLTGFIAIAVPALRTVSSAPGSALTVSARGGISRRGARRARALQVGVQVLAAVVLLSGAGLMTRSFSRLMSVDPGYRIEGVVTASIQLSPETYADRPARAEGLRAVEDYARGVPGVVDAGVSMLAPMAEGRINYEVALDGNEAPPPGEAAAADLQIMSGGYFRAMEFDLVAGRYFDERDVLGAPGSALVDASLARRLWPGGSAVGHRIGLITGEARVPNTWWQVVGVVGDTHFQSLDDPVRGTLYINSAQLPQGRGTLVARVNGNPTSVVQALRAGLPTAVAGLPEPEFSTVEAAMRATVAPHRFYTTLLLIFSGVSLLLAGVGIYGAVAYFVGERRPEIGLRLALGAKPSEVVRQVFREGLVPVAIGLSGGLAAALAGGRFVESLLYEVSARDPWALGSAGLVIGLVAGLACAVPALRAARVDPVETLREE